MVDWDSGNLASASRHWLNDEAFGYFARVIGTLAVHPRLFEIYHLAIQNTGQNSHCVCVRALGLVSDAETADLDRNEPKVFEYNLNEEEVEGFDPSLSLTQQVDQSSGNKK